MKQTFIFLFLFTALTAGAQIRQRSNTKGFTAGASVHSMGWSSEYFQYMDENAGSGIGGGLRLGYGATQLIEPYIGFDYTSMGISNVDAKSFRMTHLDFGVRFNFAGTVSRLRPFVEGGYSARKGMIRQVINGLDYVDIDFTGGTPHVGGGLNYFANTGLSFFARGIFTVGKKSSLILNNEKTDGRPDVTTFRLAIGAQLNISELTGNN